MIPYHGHPDSLPRLYISGGIKNVPNHNTLFDEARSDLIVSERFEVCDPRYIPKCYFNTCGGTTDENDKYHHTWECSLIYDIQELVLCDGIAMIPGWMASEGANLEIDIMRRLHLPFNTVNGWIKEIQELTYSEKIGHYTHVIYPRRERSI